MPAFYVNNRTRTLRGGFAPSRFRTLRGLGDDSSFYAGASASPLVPTVSAPAPPPIDFYAGASAAPVETNYPMLYGTLGPTVANPTFSSDPGSFAIATQPSIPTSFFQPSRPIIPAQVAQPAPVAPNLTATIPAALQVLFPSQSAKLTAPPAPAVSWVDQSSIVAGVKNSYVLAAGIGVLILFTLPGKKRR
jgi:hypothetical protein